MRVLVIGASGTIGKPLVAALRQGGHQVVEASRKSSSFPVDITDSKSIRSLLEKVGRVDAIVTAAGSGKWAPMESLSEDDLFFTLRYKLMGQANVVRMGLDFVNDGGSITVTSGVLSEKPTRGSAAVSMVNAGLEGFTRAAALEAPRGLRVNCVSPPWVCETLQAMGQDPSFGLPAEVVARSYVAAIEGKANGSIIKPA